MTERNLGNHGIDVGTNWMPDGKGGLVPCPELLTEEELIRFLRIPEISKAGDYHNAINQLKRSHDLPRIHICRQPLYPRKAVLQWLEDKTQKETLREVVR